MNSAKKKSFLVAVVCLILCVALLVGTTFAWFSDSVSNTGNKIQAGILDIDLLQKQATGSYVSIGGDADPVFSYDKWEPGYSDGAIFKIANCGNLALKYNLQLAVEGVLNEVDEAGNTLASVIDVYYMESENDIPFSPDFETAKSSMTKVGTLADVLESETAFAHGVLLPAGSTTTDVPAEYLDETRIGQTYVAVVLHMQESAGNEYQGKSVGASFDIRLAAAQFTYEKDGFGSNLYDQSTVIEPMPTPVHVKSESTQPVKAGSETVTFTSQGALKSASLAKSAAVELFSSEEKTDDTKDMVLTLNVDSEDATQGSITYDLTLYKTVTTTTGGTTVKSDPVKVEDTLNSCLTAVLEIGKNLNNVSVTHSGNDMEALTDENQVPTDPDGGYYYKKTEGELIIRAKSFSPFRVTYELPVVKKWDGTADTSWFKEDIKTSSEPVVLDTPEQLAGLAEIVGGAAEGIDAYDFAGKTIVIGNDMDLSGHDWIPIGEGNCSFAGSVDGKTHTISGLKNGAFADIPQKMKDSWGITSGAGNEGIPFGFVGVAGTKTGAGSDMVIKDLAFTNVNISLDWSNMTGAVIGADSAAAKIGNSYINSSFSGNITFKNVTVSGSIVNTNNTGATVAGLAGKLYTKGALSFENCTNNAGITCQQEAVKIAGIAGYVSFMSSVSMKNCVNNGDLYTTSGQKPCMAGGLLTVGNTEGYAADTLVFDKVANNGDIVSAAGLPNATGYIAGLMATNKAAWKCSDFKSGTGKVYKNTTTEVTVPYFANYGTEVGE